MTADTPGERVGSTSGHPDTDDGQMDCLSPLAGDTHLDTPENCLRDRASIMHIMTA